MNEKEVEAAKKSDALNKICQLRDDLENAQSLFLEKYGWKYSSSYPDYCWRWSKEINGKNFICNKETAMKIERDFLK